MSRLKGRVALITGAGSGIGAAAAAIFAREGASVAVSDVDVEAGLRTVDRIASQGQTAEFVEMDVTDPVRVSAGVDQTREQLGPITVLYCNAGGTLPIDGPVGETDIAVMWQTLQRDLGGVWNCSRAVLPGMIEAGGGTVVNASSMTALIGRDGADAYTAAKGAVAALTRSMAVEYAKHGIRVNAVAPGATLSPRVAARLEAGKFPQQLLDRHLLGLLEPEDIANVALFLASHESRGLTGQVIAVDSGVSIT